jgi:hypothetical protein
MPSKCELAHNQGSFFPKKWRGLRSAPLSCEHRPEKQRFAATVPSVTRITATEGRNWE